MIKFKHLTLAILIGLSTSSFAQSSASSQSDSKYALKMNSQCRGVKLNEDQARDIISVTFIKEYSLLKKFLENYCFSSTSLKSTDEESPFFFARDAETLKYLLATNVKINFQSKKDGNIDPMMFYLLNPFVDYGVFERKEVKKHLKSIHQKYGGEDLSNKTIDPISVDERRKILNLLLQNYEKKDYYHRDIFNNSISTYSLLTLEPSVFINSFTLSPHLALLQKNKDNLALIHIAFLPKSSKLPEDEQARNLSQINQFIANNVFEKNLTLTKFHELTFVDYMEVMKDNNPELYQLLKPKFLAKPKFYETMKPEEVVKTREFFNKFNYIKDLQELIPTGLDDDAAPKK